MTASNTYSNPTSAGSRSILHPFFVPTTPGTGPYPPDPDQLLDMAGNQIFDEAGFVVKDNTP